MDKRTNSQNRYYRAICRDIARYMNNNKLYTCLELKNDVSPEFIHLLNKRIFKINSTTKMNKIEFVNFIDALFAFWINLIIRFGGYWIPKDDYFSMEN